MNTLQSYWEPTEKGMRSAGLPEDMIFIARHMFFRGASVVFLISKNTGDYSPEARQAVWQGVHAELDAYYSKVGELAEQSCLHNSH